MAKLVETVILQRVYSIVKFQNCANIIGPSQVGFQPKHGAFEPEFFINLVLSHFRKLNREVFILNTDIKGAFDKVSQIAIMEGAIHAKISKASLRFLLSFLGFGNSVKRRAFIPDLPNDFVELKEGTPQGGVLSPFLFILAINRITEVFDNSYSSIKLPLNSRLSNIMYADDGVFFSHSSFGLNSLSSMIYGSRNDDHHFIGVQKYLEHVGLQFQIRKLELFSSVGPYCNESVKGRLRMFPTRGGEILAQGNLTSLGITHHSDECNEFSDARRAKAAVLRHSQYLSSWDTPLEFKLEIISTVIFPGIIFRLLLDFSPHSQLIVKNAQKQALSIILNTSTDAPFILEFFGRRPIFMSIAKLRCLFLLYTERAQLANIGILSLTMIRNYWRSNERPNSLEEAKSIVEFVVLMMEMLDPDLHNRKQGDYSTEFLSLLVGTDGNETSVHHLGTHKAEIKKKFLERFNRFSRPDKLSKFVKALGNLSSSYFPFVSGVFPNGQRPCSYLFKKLPVHQLPLCFLCFNDEDSPQHLTKCKIARLIGNAFPTEGDENRFVTFATFLSEVSPPPVFPQVMIASELGQVAKTLLAIRRNVRHGWNLKYPFHLPDFAHGINHTRIPPLEIMTNYLHLHPIHQPQSWFHIRKIISLTRVRNSNQSFRVSTNHSFDNNCLFYALSRLLNFSLMLVPHLRSTAAEFISLHPSSTGLSPYLFDQGNRKKPSTNAEYHSRAIMELINTHDHSPADARSIASIGAMFGLFFSCVYFSNTGPPTFCLVPVNYPSHFKFGGTLVHFDGHWECIQNF
jgi:hypothetical protein